MDEHKKWGNFYTNNFYGQADKRKISKGEFKKKVIENYLFGVIDGMEAVLKKVEDPEIRGEIHILLTESMKMFQGNTFYKTGRINLAKTINKYEGGN